MSNVLSRKEMRELDRWAIEDFGLPGQVLMENAGKACAEWIRVKFDGSVPKKALILCGGGNNGGDGLVIARYLHLWGWKVLVLHRDNPGVSELNRINLQLADKLGIERRDIAARDIRAYIEHIGNSFDCAIDALYGTGFRGKLEGVELDLVQAVNCLKAKRVAIDIPSGLDADNGLADTCIKADYTLVLQAPVRGNLFGDGMDLCGECHTIDIGIPVDYYPGGFGLSLREASDINLPPRPRNSHKSSYGRLIVLGGSGGMTGAPILSCKAALRAGVGYVQLFHSPESTHAYSALPSEVMSKALVLGAESIGKEAFEEAISKASAVLMGPGLGKSDAAKALVQRVIEDCSVPLILDADALNIVSEQPQLMDALRNREVLLTPHWGEFCRLAGVSMESLREDPYGCLRAFVDKHRIRLVLKSHFSLVADYEATYLITRGNAGLATGGSGDALAGIIASFAAQGMSLVDAAANAAYLFGEAAEKLCSKRKALSITPSDVIDSLFTHNLEPTDGG